MAIRRKRTDGWSGQGAMIDGGDEPMAGTTAGLKRVPRQWGAGGSLSVGETSYVLLWLNCVSLLLLKAYF